MSSELSGGFLSTVPAGKPELPVLTHWCISFLRLLQPSATNLVTETTEIECLTVWRLEVQDQNVSRVGSFRGSGENLFQASLPASVSAFILTGQTR